MSRATKPVSAMTLRRWLAANIRRLRHEQGLTQIDAAGSVEMDVRHWQALEYAEKNAQIDTIARVATALGVDPTVLISRPPRAR